MTVYPLDDEREDEQREDRSPHETTNDHCGKRSLALAADAMTECSGQQAKGGHHGSHQHTTNAGVHTTRHGIGKCIAVAQEVLDVHEHDHTVLDTDAKETDEANTCRDGEVGMADEQDEDTTNCRKGHVGKYQSGITCIAKEYVEDDKDEQHTDGDNLRQTC